jgi:hypothetical protein
MSNPRVLIEQLRRSNRRWKTLALAACAALALAALIGFANMAWERVRAKAQLQAANAAVVLNQA